MSGYRCVICGFDYYPQDEIDPEEPCLCGLGYRQGDLPSLNPFAGVSLKYLDSAREEIVYNTRTIWLERRARWLWLVWRFKNAWWFIRWWTWDTWYHWLRTGEKPWKSCKY